MTPGPVRNRIPKQERVLVYDPIAPTPTQEQTKSLVGQAVTSHQLRTPSLRK